MKKIYLFLVLPAIMIIGCKNPKTFFKGTDCSVKLSNITFTKSINNAHSGFIIDSTGTLIMKSNAKSNYFNSPEGTDKYSNAPALLTPINNSKPFTFSAQISPAFSNTYDAGALYIYSDDDMWQKFAFEKDERGLTRIISVKTLQTSDDNNHDVISNKSVYMKISSDTKVIGFYYSVDNITWQLARIYKNEYPKNIYLGISAQSPFGDGIDVAFQHCLLKEYSVKDFRLGSE